MKRLVIKIGTGNLINGSGVLEPNKASDISRQVSSLISKGIEVILVSSGAIKAGRDRMAQMGKNLGLAKKEWAGIGARHLLNLWGNVFELHNLEIAQVWLTYTNWTHQREYQSIKMSIISFLQSSIIPIINENDVVSDREIILMDQGISENDRLARMVAEMVEADAILFLTDIGGIYEEDPRANKSARRYKTLSRDMVRTVSASIEQSDYGTGGIGTKLREAFICFEKGMKVAIAGLEEDVILKFASGQEVGTAISEFSTF